MKLFDIDVPIIAILRGIQTGEAIDIAEALLSTGVNIIEVPLNSPAPFDTIDVLVKHFGDRAIFGAGTVLHVEQVERLASTGAKLMVAPNFDAQVVKKALSLGLVTVPGVYTPSEVFAAYNAGVQTVKLFPASGLGLRYLSDIQAVLPSDLQVVAVGGVEASNIKAWIEGGASGVGAASSIYKPGNTPHQVAQKAKALVCALKGS